MDEGAAVLIGLGKLEAGFSGKMKVMLNGQDKRTNCQSRSLNNQSVMLVMADITWAADMVRSS